MEPKFEQLQARIGYQFKDRRLFERALTHRSYANEHTDQPDNERLEFLGDSVLNLIVSDILYAARADAAEGDLSQRRAHLVNASALARIARQIELGAALQLGRGELSTGGVAKTSVLADALEALIGAVYLDGGYGEATRVVSAICGEQIERVVNAQTPRDFKSELQELLQSMGQTPPIYTVQEQSGPDHDRRYLVAVKTRGETELAATGSGSSKKQAEQSAAQQLLLQLTATSPP